MTASGNGVKTDVERDSITPQASTVRHYGYNDADESLLELWVMYDFLGGLSYRSTKVQMSLDCDRTQFNKMMNIQYAQSMGEGVIMKTVTAPSGWGGIIPGFIDAQIFEAVCHKKNLVSLGRGWVRPRSCFVA